MLIQFSVENYRSFDKKVTFSLAAGPGSELKYHVFDKHNMSLVKTAAIYGANASGKSNLLKALTFMRRFVIGSMKTMHSYDKIPVTPFLLNDESKDKPSSFEVVFLLINHIYRYGLSADKNKIVEEWLFRKECKPKSKEICLFRRVNQNIETRHHLFKEGNPKLDNYLRENVLYISLLDQFNGPISRIIRTWFLMMNSIEDISFLSDTSDTMSLLENKEMSLDWLNDFLRCADVGIEKVHFVKEKIDPEMMTKIYKLGSIFTENFEIKESDPFKSLFKIDHRYFSPSRDGYKTVSFDMDELESEGTKKLLSLAGPIFKSLKMGGVMLIDEIEASLHPMLVDIIIGLFQTPESNPNGAQLIFTTHNTGLLTNDRFRRDEIWFTEKDEFGATDLYSLIDYSPRKDASFNKDYLRGKYGALPFVTFEDFISSFKKHQESE